MKTRNVLRMLRSSISYPGRALVRVPMTHEEYRANVDAALVMRSWALRGVWYDRAAAEFLVMMPGRAAQGDMREEDAARELRRVLVGLRRRGITARPRGAP